LLLINIFKESKNFSLFTAAEKLGGLFGAFLNRNSDQNITAVVAYACKFIMSNIIFFPFYLLISGSSLGSYSPIIYAGMIDKLEEKMIKKSI